MNRRTAQYSRTARLALAACFFAPMAIALADEPVPVVPSSQTLCGRPGGECVATGKNVVKLRLQAFSPSTRADRRAFPGADEIPVGIARVIDQQRVESFWRRPKGISIFAGGGALALLVFGGGSSEPAASPFVPGG